MTLASAALPRTKGDNWLLWPAVAAVGISTVLLFVCSLPERYNLLLIFLTALTFAISATFILVCVLVLAVRRQFRRSGSVLLALLAPVLLWRPINWATNCLHLGLTAGLGVGYLGSSLSSNGSFRMWNSPPSDGSFRVWDWSVGLIGGPVTILIYDATDEIALPLALHKPPLAPENGFGEDCAGKVSWLLGHYYVCKF